MIFGMWWLAIGCVVAGLCFWIAAFILWLIQKYSMTIKIDTENIKFLFTLGILCFLVAAILSSVALGLQIDAKYQAHRWIEFRIMCENVIEQGSTTDNIGVTNKILEYNTWLANARAGKEAFGSWSMWCNIDLNQFHYIRYTP